MAYFSPTTREVTAKIVYYGPGMCGKTTNLQKVHELMAQQMKTELTSVATETDRTIYFDFLPVKLGKIAGFDFVVRTFTVPGQPYYEETRRMVLQGADGIVFVGDSQRYMLDQNKDSLMDLKRNLKANNIDYYKVPLIMQYNKRDLGDIMSVSDMNAALNDRKVPYFEASAFQGAGVVETLRAVTMQVFKHVRDGGATGAKKAPAKSTAARRQAAQQRAARPAAMSAPNPVAPVSAPTPAAPAAPAPVQTAARAGSKLDRQLNALVANADAGEAPMPSVDAINSQEFKNLAVLHHKLAERTAQLEKEVLRLAREHQDLKRIVGRKLLKG